MVTVNQKVGLMAVQQLSDLMPSAVSDSRKKRAIQGLAASMNTKAQPAEMFQADVRKDEQKSKTPRAWTVTFPTVPRT